MGNYSEILKESIMSWQHIFVCGDEKERTKYLKELANFYKFDSSIKSPLVIYTNHSGLEDCTNDFCEETMVDILQRDYMEWVLYSLVLEKLMVYLPLKETETLEKNLPFLLDAEIYTFEQANKALQDCRNISKDIYRYYIEKNSINQNLYSDMEIGTIYFQEFLSQIQHIIPQILNFVFIIDKTTSFGTTYKKVINNYIDERDHNIFSMKIGCQNFNEWGEHRTINGRGIEYQNSYSIVHIEDYKLNRIKKEQ